MPRVERKKKGTAGAARHCGRCGEVINPGEDYFIWSFRYGGNQRRCAKHPPRPSELTQSKLASVYAAIEACDDAIDDIHEAGDLEAAVWEVGAAAREVADEYREAAEAMGGAGYENEERADMIEGFADEVENFTCEEFAPDEPEEGEEEGETLDEDEQKENWLEEVRQEARDVINGGDF